MPAACAPPSMFREQFIKSKSNKCDNDAIIVCLLHEPGVHLAPLDSGPKPPDEGLRQPSTQQHHAKHHVHLSRRFYCTRFPSHVYHSELSFGCRCHARYRDAAAESYGSASAGTCRDLWSNVCGYIYLGKRNAWWRLELLIILTERLHNKWEMDSSVRPL